MLPPIFPHRNSNDQCVLRFQAFSQGCMSDFLSEKTSSHRIFTDRKGERYGFTYLQREKSTNGSSSRKRKPTGVGRYAKEIESEDDEENSEGRITSRITGESFEYPPTVRFGCLHILDGRFRERITVLNGIRSNGRLNSFR